MKTWRQASIRPHNVIRTVELFQPAGAAVARQLGKRRQWVERRHAIGRRLCRRGEQQLAAGRIGPTLAHRLCERPADEQDALLATIERHALRPTEALALLSAFAVADHSEQRALLRARMADVHAGAQHYGRRGIGGLAMVEVRP